jgi:rubrerythrin
MAKSVTEEMDATIGRALEHKAGKSSPTEILEMAIRIEKLTKQHYLGLAKKVRNRTGNVMFRYLAIDEANHMKELMVLLEVLKKDKKLLNRENIPSSVCPAPLPSEREIKGLEDIMPDDAKVRGGSSDLEALRLAIEVKKRAIRFYCAAMEQIGNAAGKKLLAKLAAMENKHLNELMVQYAWLDQAGFWYDASMMTD